MRTRSVPFVYFDATIFVGFRHDRPLRLGHDICPIWSDIKIEPSDCYYSVPPGSDNIVDPVIYTLGAASIPLCVEGLVVSASIAVPPSLSTTSAVVAVSFCQHFITVASLSLAFVPSPVPAHPVFADIYNIINFNVQCRFLAADLRQPNDWRLIVQPT